MTVSKALVASQQPGPIQAVFNLLTNDSLSSQLWVRQIVVVVLSLLVALTGLFTYLSYGRIVQTIGKDAVPSIVAAERIRTTLADAHTQVVNAFLNKEDADGPSMSAYRKSMAQVDDALVEASQNITYGDDERKPILTVLTQVSEYERQVGLALASSTYSEALGRADALMRDAILPATVALDEANFKHLDLAYTEDQAQARAWRYGFVGLLICLVAALAETQIKLFKTFRRIVNPYLASGTVVLLLTALIFAIMSQTIVSDIKTAKEDAFDSVHALSQAQAIAFSANAQESVYLLLNEPQAKARQTALFNQSAGALLDVSVQHANQIYGDLKALKGHGLLAEELANITFDGEDALAKSTALAWMKYVKIDRQIRALEDSGRHPDAVALCLGAAEGQSDAAFGDFTKALTATMNLNQKEFDQSIASAFSAANLMWMLLIPMLLGPLMGGTLGIQQRLSEFRE